MSDTFPDETLYPVLPALADDDRIFASNSAAGHESSQIKGSVIKEAAIAACRPKHPYNTVGTASTVIAAERGRTYRVNANGCTLTLPLVTTEGYVDGDEICVVVGVTKLIELTIVSPSFIVRGTGQQPENTPFNITGLGTFITFTKGQSGWAMSYPEYALAQKAPLASPALTGTPTAPTAASGTDTTQLATTEFVQDALAQKAPLASPALTGTPTAPTAASGTDTTQLATTEFVQDALAQKAPLASPALTGTPTAPTAATGTNTTQIATTEFVQDALDPKQDKSNAVTTDTNQVVTGGKTFRTSTSYYGPEEDANYDALYFGCGSTAFWKARQYTNGNLWIQARHPVTSAWENTLTFVFNAGIPYVQLYGTPTAPTAAVGTNTTQLATTAFCAAGFLPRFEAVVERTAATTAEPNKLYVNVKDASAENTLMLTLPSPTGNAGKVIGLTSRYRRSSYTNEEANWKLTGHIDGIASNTYWQGYWELGSALLWCDGTTWHMLTDWRAEQEW